MSGLVLVLAQAAVAFTTECHLAQTNLMAACAGCLNSSAVQLHRTLDVTKSSERTVRHATHV